MQKLSMKKQLSIIRLYLGGFSYQEVSARVGVSKGTVANVVADLRAGQILEAEGVADQLELLRELGSDLKRLKLTPGQAVAGLTVLSRLQELQIEPDEIGRWAGAYRDLAASESDREALLQAALYLEQLRQTTGLTFEELEAKGRSLEEKVAQLEPLAGEHRDYEKRIPKLKKQQKKLTDEISQFENRREPLLRSVAQNEKREAELSRRVQWLEQRAQAADERLAGARKNLSELAGLGLSLDELSGFVQRLSGVAQRHGLTAGQLREQLLRQLEVVDDLMNLETSLKTRQEDLKELDGDLLKAIQERKAEERALKRLRQQQANMHAAMAKDESILRQHMQASAEIAEQTVATMKQELEKTTHESLVEVRSLRDQTFQLGQELGQFQAVVEANQWLQTLTALVKGSDGIAAENARVITLAVLRGFKDWAQRQASMPYMLTSSISNLIRELEGWKT